MIRLLGALLDLMIRLMPTPKEMRDKEAKERRDERKDRIGRIFSGRSGVPWWVR
jgi:hypothetical protein